MIDSGVVLVWGTGNGGGCDHSSRYERVAVQFGAAVILELLHTLEQITKKMSRRNRELSSDRF